MSIVVVGTVALDTITTPFGDVQEALGGSATFFSYSASFFSPVGLVAVIGKDFPEKHISLLKNKGILTEGLERSEGKTFRWSGYYENDMNAAHTKATHLNVLETFQPQLPESYKNFPHLFLANIDPDIQLQVMEQFPKPRLIGCDTMNLWISMKPDSLAKVLKKVDLLLLNDGEARQLTGITNLIKAGTDLLKRGPKIVAIKKGEHGAILLTKDFFFVSPAYPVEDVFDPTGAGDCFAGGFFSSLISNENPYDETALRRAVILGTVMASFNVESFSLDRLTKLSAKDIMNRFNMFRSYTHFEPADHSTTFRGLEPVKS